MLKTQTLSSACALPLRCVNCRIRTRYALGESMKKDWARVSDDLDILESIRKHLLEEYTKNYGDRVMTEY